MVMSGMSHKKWNEMWKTKPIPASDCVVIRKNSVLLTRRAWSPYSGWWCLPGGLMEVGETIEKTALREIKEETGITGKIISLVGLYSGPKRDPRGTTLTVCYLVKFVRQGKKLDEEVTDMKFFPFDKLPKDIGFDHKKMIRDALKILRKNKVRR